LSWLARKIVRNTGWLFIGQFGVLLINFLAVLLVARFLGPELFGRLSFVIAGVALIVPFSQLGLNSIVTRDLVRSPADREEILGTSLVLRMFGGVIAIGLGMSAIYTLRPDDSSIQLYFLLLLVGHSFQAFMVFSHWMESEVNGRLVAICQLLVSFALAVTRIALVYTGAPLIAFIVIEALNSVLIAVVFGGAYVVGGHSLANLRFSMARATNLLRQCAPLIASSITAVIYLKIDQVMIGEIVGDSEVGIYALAARISEFWYFIPTIIVTSAFPFLLKDQERKTGRYEQRLQQLMDLLLWLGIGFAFAL
jgi:polysaccharide transporter, PST family